MGFQTDFSLEELRARRESLCDTVGDATILVIGAPVSNGSHRFRQYNDFYYLCGVEVPHSYLLIDCKSARTTLYLPGSDLLLKESDDPLISADDPVAAAAVTGVDQVKARESLDEDLRDITKVFTFMRDGEGLRSCVRSINDAQKQVDADPWDGRPNRGQNFLRLLKERHSQIEVEDVAPIIYEMRMIKSESEIKLLRRAGQLAAKGLCEAMRATKPDVMEYELAAILQHEYLAGGSLDSSYPAIVGGGRNGFYGHYHKNESPLIDGDVVLVDCAPDYHYYTSDITRVWPVNGKYTPAQRALYSYEVEYHKTLLAAIRPGRTCDEIEADVIERMRARLPEYEFASELHARGPEWMFKFSAHLAHSVGLSVHDGLSHKTGPLKAGMVFAVDPQLKVAEERIYMRVEDTVLVTGDGVEVLTVDAPLELDDIEAMVG